MPIKMDDKAVANALRTLWRKSEQRSEALARAKVKGVKGYLCDWCRCFVVKPDVDHIAPIGPTPNSKNSDDETSWDGWISRLRVPANGLQVLCKPCHKSKTEQDRKNGWK